MHHSCPRFKALSDSFFGSSFIILCFLSSHSIKQCFPSKVAHFVLNKSSQLQTFYDWPNSWPSLRLPPSPIISLCSRLNWAQTLAPEVWQRSGFCSPPNAGFKPSLPVIVVSMRLIFPDCITTTHAHHCHLLPHLATFLIHWTLEP